ncbi:MAG: hypothetical protein GX575_16475 [Candidatus Anammoximicrobium sp.]|nr:hypothetical protein [Candidatus Anammoximicrobium sp.]
MLFRNSFGLSVSLTVVLASLWMFGPAGQTLCAADAAEAAGPLRIGWASTDITPEKPVVLVGFSSARISEGVLDPITATALVLESGRDGKPDEIAILVSVDLVGIGNDLRDLVRKKVGQAVPEIDVAKIVLNATHTHCAPAYSTSPDMTEKLAKLGIDVSVQWSPWGIDMGVMSPVEYIEFAAGRIAGAIEQAWKSRRPGGVSFGLSHAVVGHNRLTAYYDGHSQMYGATNRPDFSHVEGYEDHAVNLLYTWDGDGKLTGVAINVACPSQVSGGSRITADYWHDARNELRQRLGERLFVLPQCSAAGDQSPVVMVEKSAESRMERLSGRNRRQQIAVRIADAVTAILPAMEKHIERAPVLVHRVAEVELSRRQLSEADIKTPRATHHRPQVESVEQAFERLLGEYRKLRQELEAQPERKQKRGWFGPITAVYWRLARASRVLDRYELQKTQPTMPVPVHVIRLGEMVIATNPFELYLDFGAQMKARSKAVQTFVVELADGGGFGYLPTQRSVAGGAYGAIPESTLIGPDGGRQLVERTLELIASVWADE